MILKRKPHQPANTSKRVGSRMLDWGLPLLLKSATTADAIIATMIEKRAKIPKTMGCPRRTTVLRSCILDGVLMELRLLEEVVQFSYKQQARYKCGLLMGKEPLTRGVIP